LFAFASWNSYRSIWSLSDERLVRSLDVQREQANKAFEIIDLTLNNAMELVSGMCPAKTSEGRTAALFTV
jgi:hypothetical protein